MTPEFDIIIVGSGPSGVSAAFPLVESGCRVLMVDGGYDADVAPPLQPFLTARAEDEEQWKWMVGENFHALQMREAISPKFRVPAHKSVFEGFTAANRIDPQNFIAVGSLATGGLSNAWGCGVARFSETELSEFPFPASDIEPSYETVARRVGISGAQNDDLSGYFGLDAWAQPPIQMDALHRHVYERYTKRSAEFASVGFRLGRSRVAVLSEDHAGRMSCNSSSNCLWGCHRRALYTAADELTALRRHRNFRLESGFIVEGLAQAGNHWAVEGGKKADRERRSVTARKVILAAGTLATTRLALRGLKLTEPVKLLSSPTAAFLLWLPSLLGSPRTNSFGLGQLSFALALRDGITAFGSTFSATGIPVSEFVRHLPLSRRYGVGVLRNLLNSCLVGNLFLPGHLSIAKASLKQGESLRIEGHYSESVDGLMAEAAGRLRKAYWRAGAILLPMSFTIGRPGGDIHYAGTLPMRKTPTPGETNASGELCGLDGVYVVDGACLPSLPEKSHTLTIMANADRIGRKLAVALAGAPDEVKYNQLD
jgi:choline dehydrogenase-like flavoprotein